VGRTFRGHAGGRPVRRGVRPRQRDPQRRRRREERRREVKQVAQAAGSRHCDADALGDRIAAGVDVGVGAARVVERPQGNTDDAPAFRPADDRRRTGSAAEPGQLLADIGLPVVDARCPFQPGAVDRRSDDPAAFFAAADVGVADVGAVDVIGDVVPGHLFS